MPTKSRLAERSWSNPLPTLGLPPEHLARLWVDLVAARNGHEPGPATDCAADIAELLHEILAPDLPSCAGVACPHISLGATATQVKRFSDSLDAARNDLWDLWRRSGHDPLSSLADEVRVYEQWRKRFERVLASIPEPESTVTGAAERRVRLAATGDTSATEPSTEASFSITGSTGQLWIPPDQIIDVYRRISGARWNDPTLPPEFEQGKACSPHRVARAADPNTIMPAFKAVRLRPGCVLDYVWRGDHHQGAPLLYSRLQSQAPLESVEAFASTFWVELDGYAPVFPDAFLPAIEFDDSPIGAVEFAIFLNEVSFFHWHWHSFYARREIITSDFARSKNYKFLDDAGRACVEQMALGARVRWSAGRAWVEMPTVNDGGWYSMTTWDVALPSVSLGVTAREIAKPVVIRFY